MNHRIDRVASATGWLGIAGWLVLSAAIWVPQRAAAQDFSVSAPTMTAYVINAQNNPSLTLVRGRTYTFAINAPGHPFYIKTAQVTGTTSQYTSGVTNNGATSGTLSFAVPSNAPTPLFYQCAVHAVMTGTINIVDPPPVPVGTPWSAAVLGLLLSCIGWLVGRSRIRASIPDGPMG